MSAIKLLANGSDIDLTGKRIKLATGTDAIADQIMIRLRFFLGEWFLDERLGIPYYRSVLVKNPDMALVTSIFRNALATTPGVSFVNSLELSLDGPSRALSIAFSVQTNTGDTLEFAPFIIEI